MNLNKRKKNYANTYGQHKNSTFKTIFCTNFNPQYVNIENMIPNSKDLKMANVTVNL